MTKKPWTDPYPGLPKKNLFGPVLKEGQSRPQPVERIQRPTINLKDVPGVRLASEPPCKPSAPIPARGSKKEKAGRPQPSDPAKSERSARIAGMPPRSSTKKQESSVQPHGEVPSSKGGRPPRPDGKPWEAEGISKALWYRRRQKE